MPVSVLQSTIAWFGEFMREFLWFKDYAVIIYSI